MTNQASASSRPEAPPPAGVDGSARQSDPRARLRWRLLQLVLSFSLLLTAWAAYAFSLPVAKAGLLRFDIQVGQSLKWTLAAAAFWLVCGGFLAALILCWTPGRRWLLIALHQLISWLARLRGANLALAFLATSLYAWLTLGPWSVHLSSLIVRLAGFWLLGLVNCLLLKAWGLRQERYQSVRWGSWLVAALVISTAVYQGMTFLPDISSYPFTLSWSETSRYYYASLFFAERIYGPPAPPPTVLHPSRYLLQAIPFLWPQSPLWFHRLWQVLLWLGLTAASSSALLQRLQRRLGRQPLHNVFPLLSEPILVAAWAFLFLFMGPVYYHLQVPLIMVLWGFPIFSPNQRLSWKTGGQAFLAVALASLWAGISRVNWFPVPGLLAAVLYLLEVPYRPPAPCGARSAHLFAWLRYAALPLAWFGLGTLTALAAQVAYIRWSGNEASHFTTSLSSALLWYRLWPNPTYPPGILPALLLVTLPLFLFIAARLSGEIPSRGDEDRLRSWRHYHPIRWIGLSGILLGLLVGGLVVSVKIGGGSNLHNMDAYLALLLVVGAYFLFDLVTPDPEAFPTGPAAAATVPRVLRRPSYFWTSGALLSALVFAFFTVATRGPADIRPPTDTVSKALEYIKKTAEETAARGGEVLFISNRHLLTFSFIKGVPLVADYERVFLMEMAMAGDEAYLSRFHSELAQHRFALIISEPLYQQKKGGSSMFGEENDAWVKQVSNYVLCYYRSDDRYEKLLRSVRVQLLVPDLRSQPCP